MKRLLFPLALLLFSSCQNDDAQIEFDITPYSLKAGDTAYFTGVIDATSDITQNDIVTTFTDSEQKYSGHFAVQSKDSIESDMIYLGKEEYRIAFIVDTSADTGTYAAHLTVTVGGVTTSSASPFEVFVEPDSSADTNSVKTNSDVNDTLSDTLSNNPE